MKVSLSRISASVKNDGRRTALSGAQSLCFLDPTRSPSAARKITSAIGRRILSPAMEEAMSELIETEVNRLSDPSGANVVTDPPRDFFPMDRFANVSCALLGMELLVGMARLGKYSHTSLNFLLAGSLVCMRY